MEYYVAFPFLDVYEIRAASNLVSDFLLGRFPTKHLPSQFTGRRVVPGSNERLQVP